MKVELNATQRINLHALLSMQTGKPSELYRLRSIMERIELSKEEKEVVEWKEDAGRVFWNPDKAVEVKSEFAGSPEDAARIFAVIDNCTHFRPDDLAWLEPMLDAFAPAKQ